MLFEVKHPKVGDNSILETHHEESFQDMLGYIAQIAAQWNNFHPEQILNLVLIKVDIGIPTIGIAVNDTVNVRAIFGG